MSELANSMSLDAWAIAFAVAVGLMTLLAGAWDLVSHRIPNWITVTGLVAALVFHVARGPVPGFWPEPGGISGLLAALGGFAFGFIVMLVLWLIRGCGGGDVKLMGALGAWIGLVPTVLIFLGSTFVLFVILMALALFGPGKPRNVSEPEPQQRLARNALTRHLQPARLGYAVPIALVTWTWLALKLSHLPPAP
jgi:prepilin peptidase CpaA